MFKIFFSEISYKKCLAFAKTFYSSLKILIQDSKISFSCKTKERHDFLNFCQRFYHYLFVQCINYVQIKLCCLIVSVVCVVYDVSMCLLAILSGLHCVFRNFVFVVVLCVTNRRLELGFQI